ncbi:MAG: hypothetical protein WCF93_04335 [Candidatus Moraniibacteriota bacterium]
MKKISKTDEINAGLEQEEKIIILDKAEHLKAIQNLDEQMRVVHREYLMKSAHTETSAAEVFVN